MINFNDYVIYNEGDLFWKNKRDYVRNRPLGWTENTGYRRIKIDGKKYSLHRVIYEMFHGDIPEGYQIDHINGNKLDNRIENLRLATSSQNVRNTPARSDNKLGLKNVYLKNGVYSVLLRLNNKLECFYRGNDLELAELIAEEAREKYHKDFANHSRASHSEQMQNRRKNIVSD